MSIITVTLYDDYSSMVLVDIYDVYISLACISETKHKTWPV